MRRQACGLRRRRRAALLLLLALAAAAAAAVPASGHQPAPPPEQQQPGSSSRAPWPAPHSLRRLAAPGYALQPSTTRLAAHAQTVAVAVTRPPGGGAAAELLAVYAAGADPAQTLPISFINVSAAAPAYPTTGRAHVTLKLVSVRQDLVLRLVANSTLPLRPALLAASVTIRDAAADAPAQLHLALAADGAGVVVQWTSRSEAPQQLVWWDEGGSSSSSSSSSSSVRGSACSSSRSYTADMMCGAPAVSWGFTDPGHLHVAIIPASALGHDRTLTYKVGSDAVGWSEPARLTSPPRASDVASGRRPFTFLVLGDVGTEHAVLFNDSCPPYCPGGWQWSDYTGNATKLLRWLDREHDARLALLVGDVAYANGVAADWDYFGLQFEPLLKRWPLMVIPGNHERATAASSRTNASDESGGECGVPYQYRFYTPAWHPGERYHKGSVGAASASHSSPWQPLLAPGAAPTRKRGGSGSGGACAGGGAGNDLPRWLDLGLTWYSFETGGVHFTMLDSESPTHPGSAQARFVAADLAKVDRAATPWLVVCLHRQMVGATDDAGNLAHMARLQADLEELFLAHGVDLVLQGHDHAYARTCPFARGACRARSVSATPPAVATERHRGLRGGAADSGPPLVAELRNPGAPVFVLAGHGGAGFTRQPTPLPHWVEAAHARRNGYLRVTVSGTALTLLSVSSDDGSVMDGVRLVKDGGRQGGAS